MGETHTRTCAEQGESRSDGERTPSTMAVSPCESAEFPTSVKEVLTLLVKSRRPISNTVGGRFIRGMATVFSASKRRM